MRCESIARILAWAIAVAALLNVLCFVIGTANPVLRSDDWYFLDAFVRRAIDGTLGFGDFFIKRHGSDHAQPLFKLVLWFEWRYLDLDVAFEALVGLVAACVCTLILRRFVMASRCDDGWNAMRQLAWVCMCVLLLSLNAAGIWTWPLVALGYVLMVLALLFIGATWRAWQKGSYGWLAAAVIALAAAGDDDAIIIIIAVLAGLVVVLSRSPAHDRRRAWKVVATIIGCLVLVRIAYLFAPVEGGPAGSSLADALSRLLARSDHGHWWQWIAKPLAYSVAYDNPFDWIPETTWGVVQLAVAALLLVLHAAFWLRAFRGRHNLATFSAVCLMWLSYAWLAGILVHRVALYGTAYLHQERYVQLYLFNLVALLLMLAGSRHDGRQVWRRLLAWSSVAGCALLMAVQVPLALDSWHGRRYLLEYYRNLAMQVEQMARKPTHVGHCAKALPICTWTLEARTRNLQLLSSHELNVFSPRVQRWHPYLPQTGGEWVARPSAGR